MCMGDLSTYSTNSLRFKIIKIDPNTQHSSLHGVEGLFSQAGERHLNTHFPKLRVQSARLRGAPQSLILSTSNAFIAMFAFLSPSNKSQKAQEDCRYGVGGKA